MKKLFSFFDDPILKVSDWLYHLEQNQMRDSISAKYKNKLLEQTYWITGTDNENSGLSDNHDERQVQRLILSQVSNFVAQRMFAKRNIFIVPFISILIVMAFIAYTMTQSISQHFLLTGILSIIGFILIFGTTFFAPIFAWLFLPNTAIRQDEINEIEDTIKRAVIRDLDNDIPPDLSDRKRILTVDANGKAVAGQILSSDLEFSSLRSEWIKTKSILRLFGVACVTPLCLSISPFLVIPLYFYVIRSVGKMLNEISTAKGIETGDLPFNLLTNIVLPAVLVFAAYNDYFSQIVSFVLSLAFLALALYANYIHFSPLQIRGLMLNASVKETGTELLIDKAGQQYFIAQEEAKIKQIENAANDNTPFIEIGRSTATLSQRRDNFSPTEKGITMGLSVKDLSTHLFTLGASGTGKTYGVIRPVAKKWVDIDQGGLIVLDGKGVLPLEIAEYCKDTDYTLITPSEDSKYNPVLGMSADSFADTMADICSSENESDPFWSDSARLMLRMAGNALNLLHIPLSFNSIYRFIVAPQEEKEAKLSGISAHNTIAKNTLSYFLLELPAMPDKTRDSVINSVRTWLGNIINSADLSEWVETDNNPLDVESVFTGEKIGVLLPESKYGKGGAIVSALVMRRIYDQAKKRGDRWKDDLTQAPVMMVADEIQNLLSRADIENVAIARSLGLYLVMASQNVDGLYKKLGQDGAIQMLGNFASLVSLPPKTKDSNEFLSMRVGNVWKSVISTYYGLPDSQTDLNVFNNSGTDDLMQNIGLYRRSRVVRPRLAYSLALSDKNLIAAQSRTLEDLFLCNDPQNVQERKPNLTLDAVSLVEAKEIDGLLAKPHTAIAIFNRGGVVRRDVVDLGV